MATAVRVTGDRAGARQTRTGSADDVWTGTGVAAVGGFGRAVGRLLVARGARAVPPDELTGGGFDVGVVALWRPSPEVCERVDAAAYTTGMSWLPVVAEHPYLVVGPWVQPGAGPCHRCYRMRRAQHETQISAAAALAAAYRQDDSTGPGGFLPHQARQAAGLAAVAVTAADPGLVHIVNVLTNQVTSSRVVACHGCPRCGADEPVAADGTVARTVAALVAARQSGAGA